MTETGLVHPAAEWAAESIRATNFPTPGNEFDPADWWHRLTDGEPDTRVIQPKVGEWREEGQYAGGKLAFTINPAGIIEWKLSPPPIKELPSEFPMVGRFIDACEAFIRIVRRWLAFAPPLDRLAFGAVALFPVASRRDGYAFLVPYLPDVRIDVENSNDFFYQINRRRPSRSGVEGLAINRLSKWSVFQLRAFAQPADQPSGPRLLPPMQACHVELDINTVPEYRGGFRSPQAEVVFDELVALAREILDSGDRP